MLSIRGRDGSLQGAGRSAWSAKEEDISWFAHLLESLLIRARRWPCRYCWQRCYPLQLRRIHMIKSKFFPQIALSIFFRYRES